MEPGGVMSFSVVEVIVTLLEYLPPSRIQIAKV
jgi:hypothetical protein